MKANLILSMKRIFRGPRTAALLAVAFLLSGFFFLRADQNKAVLRELVWDGYAIPYHNQLQEERDRYTQWYHQLGLSRVEIDERLASSLAVSAVINELTFKEHLQDAGGIPNLLVEFYRAYENYRSDEKLLLQKTLSPEERAQPGMEEVESIEIGGAGLHIPGIQVQAHLAYYGAMADGGFPYESPTSSVSGTNLAFNNMLRLYGGAGVLVLLLLLLPLWTEDTERADRTAIRAAPGGALAEFAGKTGAALLAALVFYGAMALFSYLLGTLFGDGSGHFHYPYLRGPQYTGPDTGHFGVLPLWQGMLAATGLHFVALALFFSFLGLVAQLLKDRNRSFVLAAFVVYAGFRFSEATALGMAHPHGAKDWLSWMQPFVFLHTRELLGEFRIPPVLPALWMLLLTGGVLWITVLLRKREVRWAAPRRETGELSSRIQHWETRSTRLFPVLCFETKKLWSTPGLLWMAALVLLVPMVFVAVSLGRYGANLDEKASVHRSLIPRLETMRDAYLEEGNERGAAGLQEELDREITAAQVYENRDSKRIIQVIRSQIQMTSTAGVTGFGPLGLSRETEEINEMVFDAVEKRGVRPGVHVGWELAHTPFDRFLDKNYEGLSALYSRRDYGSLGPIRFSFARSHGVIGIVGLALFGVMKGFSGEFGQRPPIYRMKLLPLGTHRLYLGKWAVQATLAVLLVSAGLLLPKALPLMGVLPPDGNYPVPMYRVVETTAEPDGGLTYPAAHLGAYKQVDPEGRVQISDAISQQVQVYPVDVDRLNTKSLVAAVALLLLFGGLLFAVSVFLQNDWTGMALTLLVAVGAYGASVVFLPRLGARWPFELLNLDTALTGEAYLVPLVSYGPDGFTTKIATALLLALGFLALGFVGLRARIRRGERV